jgi:hypothetical protein
VNHSRQPIERVLMIALSSIASIVADLLKYLRAKQKPARKAVIWMDEATIFVTRHDLGKQQQFREKFLMDHNLRLNTFGLSAAFFFRSTEYLQHF